MNSAPTSDLTDILIPNIPGIDISGDTILLDIEGVVPGWETYMFSLNAIQPGETVRKLYFVSSFYLLPFS